MNTLSPERLAELDKSHVWHPFTPMRQFLEADPLIITAGNGVRIKDSEGRWYYDGTSSLWVNVHGHRVGAIDAAIREQLDLVAHSTLLGQGNVPSIVLAERLVKAAPEGLNKVFYSDCGASAVEIALKLAIQYWANIGRADKRLVLGFSNNYHGDTLGAVGVAADELFHWPFMGLLPGHPRAPFPELYRSPHGTAEACRDASLEAVAGLLQERAHELAAVIVEPVQGAGGIVPSPPGFLSGLRELCDRFEVLLIVDEVATGFARTGPLFACQSDGITPDFLCLGKGISGGYLPLAATLTSTAVFDAFLGELEERKTFFHGHSYTGNPLACAAALASLDLLEVLLPSLGERVEQIAVGLEPLKDHRFVGDIRQAGFMVGIEIVADRSNDRAFPYRDQVGYLVARQARDRGLIVRPIGGVLIFMPPLGSSADELAEMLVILNEAFRAALPELEAL